MQHPDNRPTHIDGGVFKLEEMVRSTDSGTEPAAVFPFEDELLN